MSNWNPWQPPPPPFIIYPPPQDMGYGMPNKKSRSTDPLSGYWSVIRLMEKAEKKARKEKDKEKLKIKKKEYSTLEIFIIMVLLSPAIGMLQLWLLKSAMNGMLNVVK